MGFRYGLLGLDSKSTIKIASYLIFIPIPFVMGGVIHYFGG